MSQPRILTLDIETSPSLADVWGLWNQNVSLPQLREVSKVICFAAKWLGKSKVHYYSDFHDGHEEMVKRAHALLDEADIVVHYYGSKFDIPHLNREFLLAGLNPPSSYNQVDLKLVVAKNFKFASNKLDHVTQQLGLSGKLHHTGFEMWRKCMEGDPKAWGLMRRYNMQDVRTTEEAYLRILPWITNHPHVGLYTGEPYSCRNCGSTDVQHRGYKYTQVSKFKQIQCNKCGAWSRHTIRDEGVKCR